MLLLCGGVLSGGHGKNIVLSLRVNHKEKENPSLENDLISLLRSGQIDGGRWCYL